MSLLSWVPMYIKKVVHDLPRKKIDAYYWNQLWNLVIKQGDNNTDGIKECVEGYKDLNEKMVQPYPAEGDPSMFLTYKNTKEVSLAKLNIRASAHAAEGVANEYIAFDHELNDGEHTIAKWSVKGFPMVTESTPGYMPSASYKKLNALPTALEMKNAYGFPQPRDGNARFLTVSSDADSHRSWGLLSAKVEDESSTQLKIVCEVLAYKLDGSSVTSPVLNIELPQATSTSAGLLTADQYVKLAALPTKEQLANTYLAKSDVTSLGVVKYKGSVTDEGVLQTVIESNGVATGDVYKILSQSSYGPKNTYVIRYNYSWEVFGSAAAVEFLTEAEIDALCAEMF